MSIRHLMVGGSVALALSLPAPAHAQQYITDDAALTEHLACQIQMWVGQRSSWVLPVCTPVRNIELSTGFIAIWEDGADGHFEYVVQAKSLLRALTTNGWARAWWPESAATQPSPARRMRLRPTISTSRSVCPSRMIDSCCTRTPGGFSSAAPAGLAMP